MPCLGLTGLSVPCLTKTTPCGSYQAKPRLAFRSTPCLARTKPCDSALALPYPAPPCQGLPLLAVPSRANCDLL